jgi:cobalt/nickel transport system permease protein
MIDSSHIGCELKMIPSLFPLWAVHISDGYINLDLRQPLEGWPWIIGGFVVMALLAYWGSRRIRDEEIPRIALLTAAFTVASYVHVPVGPTSVHLIMNGLLGAVLGRRAALAIPCGLFLQAVAGHGGFTTLGINSCVMVFPALLAALVLRNLCGHAWVRQPLCRSILAGGAAVVWSLSVAFGLALLIGSLSQRGQSDEVGRSVVLPLAWSVTLHPASLAGAVLLGLLAVAAERRFGAAPEFPLGFLVGEVTTLLTVGLSVLAMLAAGPPLGADFAYLFFVAHLPVALVEGCVVGFLLAYLLRVKPEMIHPEVDTNAWGEECQVASPQLVTQHQGAEECPVDVGS